MKRFVRALLLLVSALLSYNAVAAVISHATVIAATEPVCCGLTADRLIDHVGLSVQYVEGSTDFDEYALANPTARGTGYFAPAGSFVDFDFGQKVLLKDFGLWAFSDYHALQEFELFTSEDGGFSIIKSLGIFKTKEWSFDGWFLPSQLEVFHLSDPTMRYLRVSFLRPHSSETIGVREVIFGTETLSTVPEPSTLLLLAVAAIAAMLSTGRVKPTVGHRLRRRFEKFAARLCKLCNPAQVGPPPHTGRPGWNCVSWPSA